MQQKKQEQILACKERTGAIEGVYGKSGHPGSYRRKATQRVLVQCPVIDGTSSLKEFPGQLK